MLGFGLGPAMVSEQTQTAGRRGGCITKILSVAANSCLRFTGTRFRTLGKQDFQHKFGWISVVLREKAAAMVICLLVVTGGFCEN